MELVEQNQLIVILRDIPWTKRIRTINIASKELKHWGEYVFPIGALSLVKIKEFQKSVLLQLLEGEPATFAAIHEKMALRNMEFILSNNGQNLIHIDKKGGGAILLKDKRGKEPEDELDYFGDHSMLVSLFRFSCYTTAHN